MNTHKCSLSLSNSYIFLNLISEATKSGEPKDFPAEEYHEKIKNKNKKSTPSVTFTFSSSKAMKKVGKRTLTYRILIHHGT